MCFKIVPFSVRKYVGVLYGLEIRLICEFNFKITKE